MGSRRILGDPVIAARRTTVVFMTVAAVAVFVIVGVGGSVPGGAERLAIATAAFAAAVLLQRWSTAAGAVAALGIGALGLAIGDAFGYGSRPGLALSLRSGAASVLLVSSAAIVVLASVALIAGLRGWPQRAAATAVAVVALVGLRSLIVAPVSDAIRLTSVVRQDLLSTTPAEVGLAYAEVEFPAADGTTLSAWYVPSSNGAAVVLAHGASSNRSSVLDHAVVLADHGYGVLMFDTRGQGRSDGRGMDLGWYGESDLVGAVTYLAERDDVDPERIGIVGVSLGGEEALGAAAADDRVRAVVADGATYRRLGDWTPDHGGGPFQRAAEWVMFTTVDWLTESQPPIRLRDAVGEIAPRPVLLIASGAGNEIIAAREFERASPGNVEVWEVPDAGHTGELDAHREEWTARVATFLDAALVEDSEARQ